MDRTSGKKGAPGFGSEREADRADRVLATKIGFQGLSILINSVFDARVYKSKPRKKCPMKH
jgi:hypothetical protein